MADTTKLADQHSDQGARPAGAVAADPARDVRYRDYRRILIESVAAAIIMALLSFPMFVYKTTDAPGGLALESRWGLAATLVALAFAGRLAFGLLGTSSRASDAASSVGGGITSTFAGTFKFVGPAMIVFAIILPFLPFSDRYIMDLAVLVLTYVMLGWGLNIVVGLAGLLVLGYVA